MKAYRYVIGRGKYVGYGFSAASPNPPYSAPWIGGLRASDTLEHQPILEMNCAKFGQPVMISSQWVMEGRPFGYTEYLEVELPGDAAEKKQFLDHPGRMLYFDFIDTQEFLSLDRQGGSGHETLPVLDISLPPERTATAPAASPNMLAALLADAWANSFQRLLGNEIKPLRLELTDPGQGAETLEAGLAFLNQTLLPRLPASVRHIISVSIGCFWDSATRGNGSTALVISLPDGHAWNMKGGYNLVTGSFQMQGPPAWQELGEALLENRDLEYYQALLEAKAYQPIAADFEVAYRLFRIHRMLSQAPVTHAVLLKAFQAWQALDELIAREYAGDAENSGCRRLLLDMEGDLIQAGKTLNILDSPKLYDAMALKAFSLKKETQGALTGEKLNSYKNAYFDMLINPALMEEWEYFPGARLWLDRQLRESGLSGDPEFYLSCLDGVLKEHAVRQPLSDNLLDGLLELYAGMHMQGAASDNASRQVAGKVLSSYAVRGLEKGFPVASIHPVRQALQVFPSPETRAVDIAVTKQFAGLLPGCLNQERILDGFSKYRDSLPQSDSEAFDASIRTALRQYMKENHAGDATTLTSFLNASRYFGWLQKTETLDTVCEALTLRGQTEGFLLEEQELGALLDILRQNEKSTSQKLFNMLDPIALRARSEDGFVNSLKRLLPGLWFNAPVNEPEGEWKDAYTELMLETVENLILNTSGSLMALLDSEQVKQAWETLCPFKWLKLKSLDELAAWYLDEALLRERSHDPLTRSLVACGLRDLIIGISKLEPGSGWFGKLLTECLTALFTEKKVDEFARSCGDYGLISGLRELCSRFYKQPNRDDVCDALDFALRKPGTDCMMLLDSYNRLACGELASHMIGVLLDNPAGSPWDAGNWDDLLLMAYISKLKRITRQEESLSDFLLAIKVDPALLDCLNPWDPVEGKNILATLLFTFHWLDRMKLEVYAGDLVTELANHKHFTRLVRHGRDTKGIFAPALPMKGGAGDPSFPNALRQWLFPVKR